MKEEILRIVKHPITWVFILAFGVRLYACLATAIVNPDGLIYIYQARALYFHQWSEILNCRMDYLSILPPMISGAFFLFKDWVIAARFISLIFGFGTLLPLYFLLKRFFDQRLVTLTLLVYAFIPALAERSADIIRGPIYWFFLSWAFLMVVRYLDDRKSINFNLNLFLSCMLFIIAAWARIEASFFLFITFIYMIFTSKGHRIKNLLSFSAPILVLSVIGSIIIILLNLPLIKILRLDMPISVLSGFSTDYNTIRVVVDELAKTQPNIKVNRFLEQASDFVWIVPLGPMLDTLAEKFFYPYVLIFFAGFCGLQKRIQEDRRIIYFLFLCISVFFMLYIFTLSRWYMEDRFLNNLILPAVLFVGFGIDNLYRFFRKKFDLQTKTAIIIILTVILGFGLGKNLKPRYAEKKIFPQMAREIIQRKSPGETVRIAAGPSNAYNWIFFYANLDVPAALCDKHMLFPIPESYEQFLSDMKHQNIRYVLWSQKSWPQEQFNLMNSSFQNDFNVIGKWDYDEGKKTFLLLSRKF
ncbi:MAG: ArnT family glycosyltransferase [Desulfosudaceae bacterium]